MADQSLDIQALVSQSGVPRRTIYFYVQQGILPPPQGAGLAASYNEEHLLRLRLIPVLRREGLRLDEIRQRFDGLTVEEMRGLVEKEPVEDHIPPTPPLPLPPAPGVSPGMPFRHSPLVGWVARSYTHYALPAGILLAVPDQLSPDDRRRLQLLLQAARQIFSGIAYADLDARLSTSSEDSSPGGEAAASADDLSTSA
jgi:DNA-binding transcriptional MerR regulator